MLSTGTANMQVTAGIGFGVEKRHLYPGGGTDSCPGLCHLSLTPGWCACPMWPLQLIQIAVLVFNLSKFSYTTPVLCTLHWCKHWHLPLVYCSVNSSGTACIQDIKRYPPLDFATAITLWLSYQKGDQNKDRMRHRKGWSRLTQSLLVHKYKNVFFCEWVSEWVDKVRKKM